MGVRQWRKTRGAPGLAMAATGSRWTRGNTGGHSVKVVMQELDETGGIR